MTDPLYRGLRDFIEQHPPMGDRDNVDIEFEGESYESYREFAAAVEEYVDDAETIYAETIDLAEEEGRDRARDVLSVADGEAELARSRDGRTMTFTGSPEDGMEELLGDAERLENYEFQKNSALTDYFANYDLVFAVREHDDGMRYAATLVSEEVRDKGCGAVEYTFPGEVAVLAGRPDPAVEPETVEQYIDDGTVEQEDETLLDQVDVELETDEEEHLFLQGGEPSGKIASLMDVADASYEDYEEAMLDVHDTLDDINDFIQSYENFMEAFAEVHGWEDKFEGGEQLGETNVARGYDASDLDFHRTRMREHLLDLSLEGEASVENIRDALIFVNLGAQNALYEDPEKRQRFREEHGDVYEDVKNAGKQLSVSGISELTATEVRPQGEFHDPTDVARVMRTMAQEEGNGVDQYLKAYEGEAMREKNRRESMGNDETAERMFQ